MSLEISVIICTHNPRPDYLSRVLAALRCQTLAIDAWELLVIDNASKDPVAPRFDISWHPHGRHIREDELGLTPARLRGIAEATAGLLVFVDDDNVLDHEYLEQTLAIAKSHPFIGAWGGQMVAEYETPPPPWIESYGWCLVVYSVKSPRWANLPLTENPCMPAGAGLCVRSSVASAYSSACRSHSGRLGLDRSGRSLVSGGDHDLVATACDLGLASGQFPQLRLTHLIPTVRLTIDYISRLVEGISYSDVMLAYYRHQVIPPQRTLTQRLLDVVRLMRIPKPHRTMRLAAQRGTRAAMQEIAKSVHR